MLHNLMEQNLLLYGMIGAGIIGVFCLAMVNRFYSGAIRDLRRLQKPKGKWTKEFLKECQLRKTNDQAIHNSEAFIRHRLMEGTMLKITLQKWKQGIGYGALLCFLFMLVAIYGTYQYNDIDFMGYEYVLTGTGIFALLFLMKQFMGFITKEDMILDGLMDYMENTCELEESHQNMDRLREEAREEIIHKVREGISQSAAGSSRFSHILSPQEEEIMRDVIREYLT